MESLAAGASYSIFMSIICLVLGRYGKGFINLALAESEFEKGEDFYEVESLAVRGRMEAESGGKIEQCFVGVGIIIWVSIFTNHIENAEINVDGFRKMAVTEKASCQLFRNLNAIKCRIQLYIGNKTEIDNWMKEAPDENEEFYAMDRLRYLTKVRVYLLNNKYKEAEILLKKILFYADKMKRTYIKIKVYLLQAILYFRMDNVRWKEFMQKAITKAEEYHFVRILSREGIALMPLLKKENFLWKDNNFKKQVEAETNKMATLYPLYLKTVERHGTVLSENALKILKLQALGKSGAEIAKELYISPATVKYHNKETYKKLGVKNKAQAINEARNRKLI